MTNFSSKIKKVEYIITENEVDALLLEANLIKLYLPRYNVKLKDDKKYPYIKITKEEFPGVYFTRDVTDRGAIYFGPYTHAKSLRTLLKLGTKLFPIRICKGKLPNKVCLAYYIRRCPGVCEGKITKKEYKENVDKLISFLTGKMEELEESLTTKMKQLSKELRFEEAARLRDQLFLIQKIKNKQKVVLDIRENLDVFGVEIAYPFSCVAVLNIREGKLVGVEHFILKVQKNSKEEEIIKTILPQYYKKAFYIPPKIVVPSLQDSSLFSLWLKKEIITSTLEDKYYSLVQLAKENAKTWLNLQSKHQKIDTILILKTQLSLKSIPYRIEAYDISNIMGEFAVGSCVVFINGKKERKGYKRFKIKTVTKINDPLMIGEIVKRRVKYGNLPNLALIDGGITQVREARKYFPKEVEVFGLAKRLEQLYTPENKIITLPKDSPALKLLQRIRNEAHRFAVEYHKKLRGKISSILEEIPGIGKKRRKLLIAHFKGIKQLKKAKLEEILKVKGIGEKYGKRVYEFLSTI
jgi:excinuclease ABC subunit C